MHHFFVEPGQILDQQVRITGTDVNHIRQVLRMKAGDELWVRTGTDIRSYRCRIAEMSQEEILADIMWIEEDNTELSSRLILYQCLPKGDKMEWIIQKAVELGAYRIVPVASARCVVQLSAQRAEKKVQRWQKVSESAAKQSRRMIVPEVSDILTWTQALKDATDLDVLLMPYELAEGIQETRHILSQIQSGQSIGILIGPEGGFDRKEVDEALKRGARSITLGRRILRTETAGMTVLSALMLHLEDTRQHIHSEAANGSM